MESEGAMMHRQIAALPRQLPITGFAHKAGVVGDARMRAVLAALDVPAECCGSADLDRRHDAALRKVDMSLVGRAPLSAEAAEYIRHLQRWTGHSEPVNPARGSP